MHILIADDEIQIANSLKKSLLAEGYSAATAEDGQQVIDKICEERFDLLLLDWRMPKLSGFDVCKKIRAQQNDIPIILITALSDISNKIEALNVGADDYIVKPFSFAEVIARINAVKRRYNTQQNLMEFDEFSLDLLTRILSFPGKELSLPEKEFDLLKYFLLNKNRIINKEMLSKDVWKLNYYSSTNFIEVTVKNLRKKLEEISGKKFIKTVYGEGYLFISK